MPLNEKIFLFTWINPLWNLVRQLFMCWYSLLKVRSCALLMNRQTTSKLRSLLFTAGFWPLFCPTYTGLHIHSDYPIRLDKTGIRLDWCARFCHCVLTVTGGWVAEVQCMWRTQKTQSQMYTKNKTHDKKSSVLCQLKIYDNVMGVARHQSLTVF